MASTIEISSPSAEQKLLGQVLKRLRKRAEISQEQAAASMGIKQQTWQRYETAGSGAILKVDVFTNLVGVLGYTYQEAMEERASLLGEAQRPTRSQHRPPALSGILPVRDRVQAGAWLQADDSVQVIRTELVMKDPRFAHAEQWLAEVVGDSVDLLRIFDGDLIHCVDIIGAGYNPKTGDIVQVERLRFQGSERELTVKQVQVTTDGILLWPRSSNPRYQEPLDLTAGADQDDDMSITIRGVVIQTIRKTF